MTTDTHEITTWIEDLAKSADSGLGAELGVDGVLRVELDRAPGNRMSWKILEAFRDLGEALRPPGPARSVLITHTGPDFCHGADLGDAGLATRMAAGREGRLEVAEAGAAMIESLATSSIPVVVGAEGKAIGGGAGLWFAADFRVASEQSSLCFPEVDRGMHLSWGLAALVAHEAGPSWARRLTLAGERTRAADLGAGLARVVASGEVARAAQDLACDLAAKPPLAVRAIQEIDNRARRRALELAQDDAAVFADTVGSRDFSEAMAAFFEKRPGVFEGH